MIDTMQQGQQPQEQQQGGTYPQNVEEASQFVNDIMRMIYSEGQPEKILDALTAGDNIAAALGQTAGVLVMTVLTRREEQTGRKPHFNLVIKGLKRAIEEMSDLMEMAGIPAPTPEELQEASQYAGQVIESAVNGKQGGGPQQPQQPQQPQGPPQQGVI